ncbi:MAG: DUF1028 domain-containing protein [Alphaproteobacteria bacterium]|nr:DUF1028 domain-containing protein [Alphaproteobacteria bacterium]
MTFSIVGRCARSGMLGLAVSSSSPAVAARCAHARARVGAVSTQNVTDPSLGPRSLDLMAAGRSAKEAIDKIVETAEHIEHRQLLAIGADGQTATFSGERTLGNHAAAEGTDAAAAGNLLKNQDVPSAMIQAFAERPDDHLGDRLLRSMRAALDAGGEAGPVHSIGMLIVDQVRWPVVDLRIDWTDEDPVSGLEAIWSLYKPQIDVYVTRALDPDAAPSYGVPGAGAGVASSSTGVTSSSTGVTSSST